MQDMDRTIASGNTIKLPIAQMRPHLIVLYPQNQFKQIPLEKGTVVWVEAKTLTFAWTTNW